MAIASELTINTTATALDMANAIFGNGITATSATYNRSTVSSGVYSGGLTTIAGCSPTDTGVILSTGNVAIDEVNAGKNRNLYHDNTLDQFNTEMDGFTM